MTPLRTPFTRPVLAGLGAFAFVLGGCSNSASERTATAADGTADSPGAEATITSSPISSVMGESVDGVAVEPLSLGPARPLPANLTVYYVPAGYGKDAVLPDLRRVYRGADDRLHEDRVFKDLGTVYTMALDLDASLIGVGVCDNQARGVSCGTPNYAAMGDAKATGFISTDSGATFRNLGALPRGAWVHAVVDGQLVIGIHHPDSFSTPPTFEYFPLRQPLVSPVAGGIPSVISGAGLAWLTADSAVYRNDGTLAYRSHAFGQAGGLPVSLSSTRHLETWWNPGTGGPGQRSPSTFYLGIFDAAQTVRRVFSWKADIRPVVQVSAQEVLGNYAPLGQTGLSFPAMILDLDTGVIHPIPELTDWLRAVGDLREPFIVAAVSR